MCALIWQAAVAACVVTRSLEKFILLFQKITRKASPSGRIHQFVLPFPDRLRVECQALADCYRAVDRLTLRAYTLHTVHGFAFASRLIVGTVLVTVEVPCLSFDTFTATDSMSLQ